MWVLTQNYFYFRLPRIFRMLNKTNKQKTKIFRVAFVKMYTKSKVFGVHLCQRCDTEKIKNLAVVVTKKNNGTSKEVRLPIFIIPLDK